ncbi:hypothetical protein LGH82_19155 [Mesorhizobium sp. PAMC28654]|uniref:hypothetical protein n=1 Tax=Mesorhizobium sp. PAMC28654 TaxID=2880934 RepID=UPI001D0B6FC4|nr:hypothetical protein [Mesorhizobium sp. PAMC28654]UDL87308.1 hypothetical protein LGH82_19155 [Mesorhizobium sp. PAMC28654]
MAISLLVLAALSPGTSYADDTIRIPIEKYNRASEVIIQRGYSGETAACVTNLVRSIRAYAGKHSGWVITINGDEAVYFNSPKVKNLKHRCVEGRQITTENGKDEVVQAFDEYGRPTMPEQ